MVGFLCCCRCSLINGPDTRSCEACNTRRPQDVKPSSSNSSAEPAEPSAADGDGFPSLSSAPLDAKQPKKGKKVLQASAFWCRVCQGASCKQVAVLPPV